MAKLLSSKTLCWQYQVFIINSVFGLVLCLNLNWNNLWKKIYYCNSVLKLGWFKLHLLWSHWDMMKLGNIFLSIIDNMTSSYISYVELQCPFLNEKWYHLILGLTNVYKSLFSKRKLIHDRKIRRGWNFTWIIIKYPLSVLRGQSHTKCWSGKDKYWWVFFKAL